MAKRNKKSTHLPAEAARARRSLRTDGAMSPSVASAAGPGEGMSLTFSLPRVSTVRAASPCRLVFQLLKHPIHVQTRRNVAVGQTHRTASLVPPLCSFTDGSPFFSLSFAAPLQKNQPRITIQSRVKHSLSSRFFFPFPPTVLEHTRV